MRKAIKNTTSNSGSQKQKFAPRANLAMRMYANQARGHKTNSTPGNTKARQPLKLTGAMLNAIGVEID